MEGKWITEKYNNWYAASTNTIGENVPELYLAKKITANLIGGFLNYIVNPLNRLTITAGLRADFFSYNKNTVVSPRFGSRYQLTQKTAINFSTGLFYQHLPLLLLSQNENFKNLRDLKAIHCFLSQYMECL